MLYVVSGFMRCGTSMMMRSLEAGGMSAAYSERRDAEMNARWGDAEYTPNDSYYELELEDYLRGDLAARFDGQLIKCLWGGMLRLPPCDCRVIFMRRPAKEIRLSLMAFFGSDTAAGRIGDLDKTMGDVVQILRDRKSFRSVDVVHYYDVLARPQEVFEGVAATGWPIDVSRAAAIPSLTKARFS